MSDTLISGAGFICSVVPNTPIVGQSTVIPPVPLNFDGGETWLVDVTTATAYAIVSITLDSNNLVTQMIITGTPASGDGFCQALSAASAGNLFPFMASANAAAVSGDIVMYTPHTLTQSLMTSRIGFITVVGVTYRSASPIWKLYAQSHEDSGPTAPQLKDGVIMEDIIINVGRDSVALPAPGTQTAKMRRCYIQCANITAAGSGSIFILENCILWSSDLGLAINTSSSADMQIRHSFILRSIIKPATGGTISLDNSIAVMETGSKVIDGAVTGDWNWSTDGGTLPGVNSLKSKNLDDLKLAHAETELNGFPTGPLLGFFPTPAAVFGFAGSPPTILGSSDAERRDFYGNLRPSAGEQTVGAMNVQDHDGGVVWGTYQGAATGGGGSLIGGGLVA